MASGTTSHNAAWLRRWGPFAVIVLIVAAVAYLVFEFGRIQAGYNIVDAANDRRQVQATVASLADQVAAQKEQIRILETHRDIDRESYREVEKSLTQLQAKIQEQREAIAFYRGIVSPVDGNSGLRVEELKLTRGKAEHEFALRLVLVQSLQHDRKVSGVVSLSLVGDQAGEDKTYSYAELLPPDGDASWPFSFRYFQDFTRTIVLPDGFTPETVNVKVESKTRSIDSVEASFSWSDLQG